MSPVNQLNSSLKSLDTSTESATYGNFDKLEVLRLITQCLDDMDYHDISNQLKSIHGASDDGLVQLLLENIENGKFKEAENLVEGLNLLPMTQSGDIDGSIDENYGYLKIKYFIKRQHFLEILLVQKDQSRAITFLRSQFRSLNITESQIRLLSSLVLDNHDLDELRRAGWVGSVEDSRLHLSSQITEWISPESLLPKHRLLTLLEQAVEYQRLKVLVNLKDNPLQSPDQRDLIPLYKDLTYDKSKFPTRCIHELTNHDDEVWFVKFSNNGKYLCSTSKDSKIIIYNVDEQFTVKHELLESSKSVSYASWSPDDKFLLTCGMDLHFRLWDVESGRQLQKIKFFETVRVWTFGWLPDSSGFITASPDKKLVWFKLGKNDCKEVYDWDLSQRIADLAVTKDGKKLLTITHSNFLEVYSLETKLKIGSANIGKRLTSITTSQDSKHCIINVAPEEIQLWNIDDMRLISIYIGQQQQNYVIRSSFGNWDESVILSGSEDGRIYIWNREYCALIFALDAHKGLVNGVDWNINGAGYYGKVFASAGDDRVVRIWGV